MKFLVLGAGGAFWGGVGGSANLISVGAEIFLSLTLEQAHQGVM